MFEVHLFFYSQRRCGVFYSEFCPLPPDFCFSIPQSLIPAGDGNGKIRTSQNTPVTVVTFHWFYRNGKTILVFNQYLLSTQVNTNMASFTPLIEYLYGCPGIFTFLLFYAVLKLFLLG